jgi:hypothetical protein
MIKSVPYILVELPMNLLMKRLGANGTLPIMVILWGTVCACQGSHFPPMPPSLVLSAQFRRCPFLPQSSLVSILPWGLEGIIYWHDFESILKALLRRPLSRDCASSFCFLQAPCHAGPPRHAV